MWRIYLLLEAESSDVIGIEEPQEAGELVLTDAEGTLISQEVLDFDGAYCKAVVAVKPLEG